MAKTIPDGWQALSVTGQAKREIETLGLLATALPDGYSVYHAVHWTQLDQGFAIFGEIDFEILDNKARRKLFIGMTRAQLKLILIASKHAGVQMLDALG